MTTGRAGHTGDRPAISVVMANYNGAPYLPQALESVLSQTMDDLEIIVCDDASQDDSIAVVQAFREQDDRVRLIEAQENAGPARARNRALDAARGEWIAIVDSDDILHPERFERLLAAADHYHADAVADDLLHFASDGSAPASLLLHGDAFTRPFRLTAELFVRGDVQGSDVPNFGYLKPMIRTAAIGTLRYDEALRIGEDYDFLLRLLLRGLRLHLLPEPTYLYRRHDRSISHRLSVETVADMIDGQKRLLADHGALDPPLEQALAMRMAGLRRSLRYERLVRAIKDRRPGPAAWMIARDPTLLLSLFRSMRDRRARNASGQEQHGGTAPGAPARTILLTDDAETAAADETAIAVPQYHAPGEPGWSGAAERALWQGLADLGRREGVHLTYDGLAGAFAAGFAPFALSRVLSGQERPISAAGHGVRPEAGAHREGVCS